MHRDAFDFSGLRRGVFAVTVVAALSGSAAFAQHAPDPPPPAQNATSDARRDPITVDGLIEIASELNEQYGASLRQRYEANPNVEGRRLLGNQRLRQLYELRAKDREQYDHEVLKVRTEAAITRLAQRLRKAKTTGLTTEQIELTRAELRTQLRLRDRLSLESREAYLCEIRDHIRATEKGLATYLDDAERFAQEMYDALIAADQVDVKAVGPAQFAGWGFDEAGGVQKSAPIKLTPELAVACLEVVRSLTPEVAEELEALRSRDAQQFRRRIASSEQLLRLGWLKIKEPAVYDRHVVEIQAQQDISRIVKELQEARDTNAPTERLETDLMNRIRIRVAMKFVLEQERVKQLRARLVELEASLDADRNNVDARLDQQLVDLDGVPE